VRIDAHIHFWMPSCGFDNKPIADQEAYRRDFLPSTVAPDLDAAGIDGVILVQTAPQTAETDWLLGIAENDDRIVGVTGWVDLDVEQCDFGPLLAQPKLVGIRAQLRRIGDAAFICRPNVVRNIAAALAQGLALTILAEERHHPHVLDVIEQLPRGPITLNHLGLPFPDVDRARWRGYMRAYAARPDLYLQFSGLPFLFGDRWRDADACSVLDDAVAIFGPPRLMFASDWPMMVRFTTYGEWVRAVEDFMACRGFTANEQEAVFSESVLQATPRLERDAIVSTAQRPSGDAAIQATNQSPMRTI
jgi:L-fuconolactonase